MVWPKLRERSEHPLQQKCGGIPLLSLSIRPSVYVRVFMVMFLFVIWEGNVEV